MDVTWTFLAVIFVISDCKGLVIVNDSDPGQCDASNHGTQVLVLDREKNEKVYICTKNNGLYQWTTEGGYDPIGELFSPGYDCSKILDNYPEAKDGMYWIHLGHHNKPKKVYCDMTTDGGGYMLIGRKNTSVTWTLPSDSSPVEPYGKPHWSSNFGDAPILDFRIQIATVDDFQSTKSHWSFRFNSERPLKNLMIDNLGCDKYKPGIGNIAYVKDIQTDEILNTGFRCSIFGGFSHPSTRLGWHKMNKCLNEPCKSGYAYMSRPYHPDGDVQMDFHGSFSFSASANHSGMNYDATAFVGCAPNQVCCGCFGPAGGTGDYCSSECTAKNGGTVVKNHTSTWFWMRTSLPKRVWNRCMEYKIKEANGEVNSYKFLDGNPTPEKGTCPKSGVLMNEGIVVVPDAKTSKKVPPVPGIMQYRQDEKKLYIRSNETWEVLEPERKILRKTSEIVSPILRSLGERLKKQNTTVNKILSGDIVQLKTVLQQNVSSLRNENAKVRDDVSQIKTQNLRRLQGNITELKNIVKKDFSLLETGLKNNIVEQGKKNMEMKNEMSRFQRDLQRLEGYIAKANETLEILLSIKDPLIFESVILFGEPDYRSLLKIWIGRRFTAKLCWRATRDGWDASIFHTFCDNKKPTVTLVKCRSYIFGGYATESWEGSSHKKAPGSFIFSLRNSKNMSPFKAPLKNQNDQCAIHATPSRGPTFGCSDEVYLSSNANRNSYSRALFSSHFQAPPGVTNPSSILAGNSYFTPSEIEVFYLL